MRYADLLEQARRQVAELMPWDLEQRLIGSDPPLLLDVREPAEFAQLRLAGSINVPRGVLEAACEWDQDVTEPVLVRGRARDIVVLCRSGQRSLLAAVTLQTLGFTRVSSLRTGVRGWNDAELPLLDEHGQPVDVDHAETLLTARVRPEQRRPASA